MRSFAFDGEDVSGDFWGQPNFVCMDGLGFPRASAVLYLIALDIWSVLPRLVGHVYRALQERRNAVNDPFDLHQVDCRCDSLLVVSEPLQAWLAVPAHGVPERRRTTINLMKLTNAALNCIVVRQALGRVPLPCVVQKGIFRSQKGLGSGQGILRS